MGVDGKALGLLLESHQVAEVIASCVGEHKLFAELSLAGELEVEFTPQGTLAERLRAGGAGIPAFYARTSVGTLVAEGIEHETFEGHVHIRELAIVADIALVRAHLADTEGDLVYRHSTRNVNPVVTTAGHFTVVEAKSIMPVGDIEPDLGITPGVYVQRVVLATDRPKDIEQPTVRRQPRGTRATEVGA